MRISIEESKKDVGESQTPGLTSQFTGKTKIEEDQNDLLKVINHWSEKELEDKARFSRTSGFQRVKQVLGQPDVFLDEQIPTSTRGTFFVDP